MFSFDGRSCYSCLTIRLGEYLDDGVNNKAYTHGDGALNWGLKAPGSVGGPLKRDCCPEFNFQGALPVR